MKSGLARQPAVVLLGPRQVGKTTLAHQIVQERNAIYLDLEDPSHRARLQDPGRFLAARPGQLVVLDEIHRIPELFGVLRGVIDEGRRGGLRAGRFLLLGSASLELLRQAAETLAGRVAYVELGPLEVGEIARAELDQLWLRGGFPESFLAVDDAGSLAWRRDFVRSYLERDVPALGPRIPAETLRRLWTMLAHEQGQLFNAARLATSLGVSAQTVARYADLLVDLLLVRRLLPVHTNVGKRLVKSPRLFLRDSGTVHALLGIANLDDLLGHPVAGSSWEGLVIENLIAIAPLGTVPGFYRTAAGAEVDLVLDLPDGKRWVIEVKRGRVPTLQRGFHHAREDLRADRCIVIHSGEECFPMGEGIEAMGLADAARELAGA